MSVDTITREQFRKYQELVKERDEAEAQIESGFSIVATAIAEGAGATGLYTLYWPLGIAAGTFVAYDICTRILSKIEHSREYKSKSAAVEEFSANL